MATSMTWLEMVQRQAKKRIGNLPMVTMYQVFVDLLCMTILL